MTRGWLGLSFQFPWLAVRISAAQHGAGKMFGKRDAVDSLAQNLERARAKREALAYDVTTLSEQIAELETRLFEEKDRRERERVLGEIDESKKELEEAAATFAPVIARLCDATAAAAALAPKAGELNGVLAAFAAEVESEIGSLLGELRRRAETVRGAETSSHLPPSKDMSRLPENHDREPLILPAFLHRNRETQEIEAAKDQCRTEAAKDQCRTAA